MLSTERQLPYLQLPPHPGHYVHIRGRLGSPQSHLPEAMGLRLGA